MEGGDERGGRSAGTMAALLPLFFVSGGTALTYQTIWVRELQLVFGTSTFAISTVLSAFMAGLAAGGFVAGRIADRVPRPLAAYGLLEIGIGAYALVFPYLVQLVTPLYLSVHRGADPGPVAYGVIQFALVGATLLLPTALMGATLPLLARFATESLGKAGDRVGTLYSVNTLGAVAGTLLCGFFLLPGIGRFATTLLAAGANLALGLAAIALDRTAGGPMPTPAATSARPAAGGTGALALVSVAIGLAGFSALVYEVAWTRLLGLMLGGSTYSFSLMLLAFLTGIAIGGKLGGPIADRLWARGGVGQVLVAFAMVEVSIAFVSFALMYVYPELPFWYVWIFDWFEAAEDPMAVWVVSLAVAGAVMTPPAVLMGIHFPMAVRAVIGDEEHLGGPVGVVYGANTLGGVAGAFLAGFVFLPNLWVQGTILAAAVGEIAAALLLLAWAVRSGTSPLLGIGLTVGVAIGSRLLVALAGSPPWDPMLMTSGMYHYVTSFDDHSREGIQEFSVDLYDLVYYDEGLSSVVTVAKNKDSGNIWLANNGKVDASTTTDMPTQVLCSLLPMQFVERPDNVLVIGLASGVTAGALSQVTDIGHLEVVELEPTIEEAARYFKDYNHDIVGQARTPGNVPKVSLLRNDGRNQVLLAPERSYDVIVSEPPNPWISGVANLFTKDFLEIGKTRLKPGGVWSQWVQLYGMSPQDVQLLLRTFAEVYPHVLVYSTIQEADLVLVGSESPLLPTPDRANRLFKYPGVRKDLATVGISGPTELVAIWSFDRDEILTLPDRPSELPEFVEPRTPKGRAGRLLGLGLRGLDVFRRGLAALGLRGRFNTDDNMWIEYSAPLNLHAETQDANVAFLLEHQKLATPFLPPDANLAAGLARTYYQRDDVRAIRAMEAAIAQLPADDERRALWAQDLEAWRAEFAEALVLTDE